MISYLSLVIGHWSLVIGHWSLVIGPLSLVIGHWSLVIGHSLLVLCHTKSGIHKSVMSCPVETLHATSLQGFCGFLKNEAIVIIFCYNYSTMGKVCAYT
ncbi:MAG: hypothetical protein F6K31_36380 [Symploca sp. SIO2G7]|nr:hypothetical protein [Symploca sp. SIO2G7]